MITGSKILVTGATGQMARPIAEHFAKNNEVWVIARFTDTAQRTDLESRGFKTWAWTMGQSDFTGLPDDFDYVVSAAASIYEVSHDYDAAIRNNAEGTGLLMAHVRKCKALLYISSLQVYSQEEDNSRPRLESDALGCHVDYAPSYSAGKLAAEAVVRTLCRLYDIPCMIARLGMAYGVTGHGGAPTILFNQLRAGETVVVPPMGVSYCALLSEEDIVRQVEPLLHGASIPTEIVNWCGDVATDEREMSDFVADLMGRRDQLKELPEAGYRGGAGDITNRSRFTGPCQVEWRDGLERTLRARYPDYPFAAAAATSAEKASA